MTKLMEWLAALIAFLAFYMYLVTGESSLRDEFQLHIKLMPIYLVILFGVSKKTRKKNILNIKTYICLLIVMKNFHEHQ